MKAEITIRIRPDGSLYAETHGLKGDACLPYIPIVEALTDSATVASHFTPEFDERALEITEDVRSQELDLGE